jgi:hypothetical protein
VDISPIILSVLEWGAVALAGYTVKKIHDVVTEIRRSYAAQTDQADAIGKLTKSVSDLSTSLDAVHDELTEAKSARTRHERLSDAANVFEMRDHLLLDHDRLVAKGWASYDERLQWHAADDIYEQLVASSGQTNGVMQDYAEDIDELPTAPPEAA